MTYQSNIFGSKFVSCIESRFQDNGELYARFNLGTFVEGQALTVANALRRTLLSEIPGFVITSVEIDGANHEFATLPGVNETVLNLLLNLKRLVITSRQFQNSKSSFTAVGLEQIKPKQFQACLDFSGPGNVTAADINFPALLAPVNGNHLIATLSASTQLKINLDITLLDPTVITKIEPDHLVKSSNKLILDSHPKPVRRVNYSIHEDPAGDRGTYIALEIWTDGSIYPTQALEYTLESLTRIFYEFTQIKKNSLTSSLN